MTKSKNTKKALLASVLSMMLCMAMLIGSTFAWFIDSVTSGKNKIVAGNLDVEMEYALLDENGKITGWESVEGVSLFNENARWEPGYTQVVYLRVKNVGSLSLNYKLAVAVDKEHPGVNEDRDTFYLSDFLKFGVLTDWDGNVYADRSAARAAIGEGGKLKEYAAIGSIKAGEAEQYIALVVYMPEDVGNEANYTSALYPEIAIPYIDFGISLEAHQMVDENDSFGNTYDENAFQGDSAFEGIEDENKTEFILNSEKDLLQFEDLVFAGNTFEGKTIKLGSDITLAHSNWKPVGNERYPFKGTFDGDNHTISGLAINQTISDSSEDGTFVGFFGYVEDATIENLKLDGTICITGTGAAFASGFAGFTRGKTSFLNCVNNVNIDIDIDGDAMAAGIAGNESLNSGLSATECVNNGSINVKTSGISIAGGIFTGYSTSQGDPFFKAIECQNNGALTAVCVDDIAVDIDKYPW